MDAVEVKQSKAIHVCKKMMGSIPSSHQAAARDRKLAASRMKYSVESVVKTARSIFAGEVNRVTIVGPSGCGKSTGAALLVSELAKLVYVHFDAHDLDPAGRDLAWWNWSTLWTSADDLAQAADAVNLSDGCPELVRSTQDKKIAIVDDLGNERGWKPNSNKMPPRVIQDRYENHRKVTIVTTGLTSVQILSTYGAGVERRLSDDSDKRLALLGVFGAA